MAQLVLDDHDLLVRLDAKLDGLSTQFSEVKATIHQKADTVRVEKLDLLVDKLETRLDSNEHKLYMLLGGVAVLEVVLKIVWK